MVSVYTSMGALGVLYTALAFRMSMYRLAGSPGEDEPNSRLNRFHELQMLTAEWTPIGIGLGLALVFKNTAPTQWIELLVAAVVLTRYVFAATRILKLSYVFGVLSMTGCYIATFAMSGLLIAY